MLGSFGQLQQSVKRMTSNPEVSYLRQLLGHCSRLQSREKQNSHRRQSPVLGHEEVPTSVASVTSALCPLLYQQVAFFFKGPPTEYLCSLKPFMSLLDSNRKQVCWKPRWPRASYFVKPCFSFFSHFCSPFSLSSDIITQNLESQWDTWSTFSCLLHICT